MAIEKAKITFEHSDGRKIVVDIESNDQTNETIMKSNFGDIGPEHHHPGIHGELYVKLMSYLQPFSKEK